MTARPFIADAFATAGDRRDAPEAASPILGAARQLQTLWDQDERLDEAHGNAEPREAIAIERQRNTVDARIMALEDAISTLRAATLGEAAVQLALAIGRVDPLCDEHERDAASKAFAESIRRLLSSVIGVVVRESGIDPKAHAMLPYAGIEIDGECWPSEVEREAGRGEP